MTIPFAISAYLFSNLPTKSYFLLSNNRIRTKKGCFSVSSNPIFMKFLAFSRGINLLDIYHCKMLYNLQSEIWNLSFDIYCKMVFFSTIGHTTRASSGGCISWITTQKKLPSTSGQPEICGWLWEVEKRYHVKFIPFHMLYSSTQRKVCSRNYQIP